VCVCVCVCVCACACVCVRGSVCSCAHEARVRVQGNGVRLARADSEHLLMIDTKPAVRYNKHALKMIKAPADPRAS
jgi:hypothetical protein